MIPRVHIALNEDWAKHLCYCDMEGFAIQEDGTLILTDECGKFAYCPEGRFLVDVEEHQHTEEGEMARITEDELMPDCLKDFHDAKDLFKALWTSCMTKDDKADHMYRGFNWRNTMCFVMDKFLWFMAQHGYVLRQARHKRDYANMGETIEKNREQSANALEQLLKADK